MEILIFLLVVMFGGVGVLVSKRKKAEREKRLKEAVLKERNAARKREPLLHISPDRISKIQSNLDFVAAENWKKEHPIDNLDWNQILGPKKDQIAPLAGVIYSSEVEVLTHVVLVACLAERDPRFFNSDFHKQVERRLGKDARLTIKQLTMINRSFEDHPDEVLGHAIKANFIGPSTVSDMLKPSPVGIMLESMRSAAWGYIDPLNPSLTAEEQSLRLLEATRLLKLIATVPEGRKLMLSLLKHLKDAASTQIDEAIQEVLNTESDN